MPGWASPIVSQRVSPGRVYLLLVTDPPACRDRRGRSDPHGHGDRSRLPTRKLSVNVGADAVENAYIGSFVGVACG